MRSSARRSILKILGLLRLPSVRFGVREDRRAWDERQEGMRGAGRQQADNDAFPNRPKSSRQIATPRGAGAVRRGHLLRQQSQIRRGDCRRASKHRHRRERQDRAAHDGEEGAGILQGPQEVQKGGKASDKGTNALNRNSPSRRGTACGAADITYIPTREGWLYLATYLDLFSRKIVDGKCPASTRIW